MEQFGQLALVAASLAIVAWVMLRKLGVGPSAKPDCGCGHCAEKKLREKPPGLAGELPDESPKDTRTRTQGDNTS